MQRSILFGLAGLGLIFAGCTGNSTTGNGPFNQPAPRIRAINAMQGVSSATWMVTGQNGVSFPAVAYGAQSNSPSSPYVILNENGQQTVEFFTPASPNTAVASLSNHFAFTQKLTAVAYGTPSPTASELLLFDQTASNTTGAPNVRFVNVASHVGSLDIFMFPTTGSQPGVPTAAALPVGSVSPAQQNGTFTYLTLPGGAGAYTVNVFAAGTDTGAPLATAQVTVAANDNWTIYLMDPVTGSSPPTILPIQDNNVNAG